jgi:N-methylhydantoinase B
MELQEALYPFRFEGFELREDSGGAGKYRGGLGFRRRYVMLGTARMQIKFDRIQCPPWGVAGGKEGRPGWVTIEKAATGATDIVHKSKNYPLEPGDRILVETGGGGGYGPAAERAPELLDRDVRRGYVTAEAAQRDYGRPGGR